MISSRIKFEDNVYIVKLRNNYTGEEVYKEFHILRDATDYILDKEGKFYEFEFSPIMYEANYERFKYMIESGVNSDREVLNEILLYNECLNRLLIKTDYYLRVNITDCSTRINTVASLAHLS